MYVIFTNSFKLEFEVSNKVEFKGGRSCNYIYIYIFIFDHMMMFLSDVE